MLAKLTFDLGREGNSIKPFNIANIDEWVWGVLVSVAVDTNYSVFIWVIFVHIHAVTLGSHHVLVALHVVPQLGLHLVLKDLRDEDCGVPPLFIIVLGHEILFVKIRNSFCFSILCYNELESGRLKIKMKTLPYEC